MVNFSIRIHKIFKIKYIFVFISSMLLLGVFMNGLFDFSRLDRDTPYNSIFIPNYLYKPGKVMTNGIYNVSRVNIIFDASHHQLWSIWDTGFVGLSDLAILLMDQSFSVSASTDFINVTVPKLKEGDIYVLDAGKEQTYTDQEVNLIVNFVDQGGSILVLGEHDNKEGMADFQNKLLENFNITINDDHITDDSSCYAGMNQWISVNSSFFNVDNITLFSTATLTLGNGAFSIANSSSHSSPPNAIIVGGCEYGNGRVVGIADTEFLWNGDSEEGNNFGMGIKVCNNTEFTLKLFYWLAKKQFTPNNIEVVPEFSLFTADNFALNLSTNGIYNITTEIYGGTINPSSILNAGSWTTWNITVNEDGYVKFIVNNSINIKSCYVYFLKPNFPTNSIFISEANYSRKAEISISGLYNFSRFLRNCNFSVFSSKMELNLSNFDTVCIANPLQNISNSQISNLTSSKRLLVLGESYSTLLADDFFNTVLRGWGFTPIPNPINDILTQYKIELTHYLIVDNDHKEHGDIVYPLINGPISDLFFPVYQSSMLNYSTNLNLFAQGYDSSWGENSSCLGYASSISYGGSDVKPTPFAIYNSSIMVMGDTDIITNERGDAYLFPFIECWLKTGKPYNAFDLSPSKNNLTADGLNSTFIISGKINDSNGEQLDNGTLITVSTNMGTIIDPDEDTLTAGIQISIKANVLNFTLQSEKKLGIANISAFNFSYAVIGQTYVEFIDKIPPTSNHPEDIDTDLYGVETINWTLWDDFGPGFYQVWRNDSIDSSWISWSNDTSINYEIDRSQTGIFNYTIIFNDSCSNYGNPDLVWVYIAPDLQPTSNQPDDIITNTSGTEQIGWILWDDFGEGYYQVLINGTPDCPWTSWTNDTLINYDINRTQFGLFNYTIIYNDSYGNMGDPDVVLVEVLVDFPPTVNEPEDIITNSTGTEQIEWIILDDFGNGFYQVLFNGTPDSNWLPWYNNTPINYQINRSFSGVYNYTIIYNDSFNNFGNPDVVIVTVDFNPFSNNPVDIITNSTGNETINWIIFDDFGNGYYQVLINGTPDCPWRLWFNNTQINYNISRTFSGVFNYTIVFNDSFGNWGSDQINITVNFPPTATQPNNISSYIFDSERIHILIVDDFGAGQFRVWINDSAGDWLPWSNNSDLNYEINRTNVGIFNYTFEYYDVFGLNGNTITLFVTLWDQIPSSNHPGDVIVYQNDVSFIHWIVFDDFSNGSYHVLINGTPTNWLSWKNNTDIRFRINSSLVGLYNYTLVFTDESGNYGQADTVIVIIKERPINLLLANIFNLTGKNNTFNTLIFLIGAFGLSGFIFSFIYLNKRYGSNFNKFKFNKFNLNKFSGFPN